MCTLNEAGRKSTCASGCERRPVHEASVFGTGLKLEVKSVGGQRDHRQWAKKASHANVANHDRRDGYGTKVDSRRSFGATVGRRAEDMLEKQAPFAEWTNMHCRSSWGY